MFFSEYALEDILKSGVFEDNTDQNEFEAFRKKGGRRQRPKNPFHSAKQEQSSQVTNINNTNDLVSDDHEDTTDEADEEFQQLYDELHNKFDSAYFGGKFEEIYENLTSLREDDTNGVGAHGSGSFLPPEILALHTECHSQRMGVLSRYVELESGAAAGQFGDQWSQSNDYHEWNTGKL